MIKKTRMRVSNRLIDEIVQALNELGGWGSLEIYVQSGKVTQITKRAIKKTSHPLPTS